MDRIDYRNQDILLSCRPSLKESAVVAITATIMLELMRKAVEADRMAPDRPSPQHLREMADVEPAFEVIVGKQLLKVWPDGRTDVSDHGGAFEIGAARIVINRIPKMLSEAAYAAREKKPVPVFVAAPAPEEGWTEWFGGASPVRLHTPVDVVLGDGKQYSDIASSFDFNWGDDMLKRVKKWRHHVPPAPANALPVWEDRWRERPITAGMLADVLDNRTDRITAHVLMHDLIHLAKVAKW